MNTSFHILRQTVHAGMCNCHPENMTHMVEIRSKIVWLNTYLCTCGVVVKITVVIFTGRFEVRHFFEEVVVTENEEIFKFLGYVTDTHTHTYTIFERTVYMLVTQGFVISYLLR